MRGAIGLLALAAVWLAAFPSSAVAAAPPSASASARRSAAAPDWIARQRQWDVAQGRRQAARWSGTLDEIVQASAAQAAAESIYLESLTEWALGESLELGGSGLPAEAYRGPLRRGVFDLIEHRRTNPAARILHGPLQSDRTMIPVRARVTGLLQSPDSGLSLLAWPPDRRAFGPRPLRWDALGRARGDEVVPALLAAAELADSARDPRARRAALWRLSQETRPSVQSLARMRLARLLVAQGEPRLAGAILGQARGASDDERLLFANLRADRALALGDTLGATAVLVDEARDPVLSTTVRYPLVKRAATWMRGSRPDSLDESRWLELSRMLGDVGEGETALAIMKRRRSAPPDETARVAREEIEAAILLRLKKNQDAAALYGTLLARQDLPAASRAKYALGLARARRGAGEFEAMDRAFLLAASLDSAGATGSVAAWERSREWEDRRPPAEAARVYAWARAYARDATTAQAVLTHGAIAYLRAGQPDSASAFLESATGNVAQFWRGQIAFAAGDSAKALVELGQVKLGETWSYEGVRAAEEVRSRAAGSSVGPRDRPEETDKQRRATGPYVAAGIPTGARILGAVEQNGLMMDLLRECALSEPEALSRACIDGLEERGVFRVGKSDAVPRERLEYPPAYPVAVLTSAGRESLSAPLLWAIMRQESAYRHEARSKAGALGLLQLLPSTASRLNRAPVTEAGLVDPDVNVRLGARYVGELLEEFGDPRAAIAAYNAGEDAVRRWKRDRPKIDDMWVEMIPYRETRDYVKQVYTIWRRYQALYGVPTTDRE